jgi:hypothetical protein
VLVEFDNLELSIHFSRLHYEYNGHSHHTTTKAALSMALLLSCIKQAAVRLGVMLRVRVALYCICHEKYRLKSGDDFVERCTWRCLHRVPSFTPSESDPHVTPCDDRRASVRTCTGRSTRLRSPAKSNHATPLLTQRKEFFAIGVL